MFFLEDSRGKFALRLDIFNLNNSYCKLIWTLADPAVCGRQGVEPTQWVTNGTKLEAVGRKEGK